MQEMCISKTDLIFRYEHR